MKGYVERFGQRMRVSYDPITKAFIEVPVEQLRFLPGNFTIKPDETPVLEEAPVMRYAAE